MKHVGALHGVPIYSHPSIPEGEIWGVNDDWKMKIINRKTYRGRGRPRKSDYQILTVQEAQRQINGWYSAMR